MRKAGCSAFHTIAVLQHEDRNWLCQLFRTESNLRPSSSINVLIPATAYEDVSAFGVLAAIQCTNVLAVSHQLALQSPIAVVRRS